MALAAPQLHSTEGAARIHTIHMGEYAAHRGDVEIRTLLGSCVCVCLWDPVARIGGANHFQLPAAPAESTSARYGVHAMELLINRMLALGGERKRFLALAFGGAAVLPALSRHHVGERNARFARGFLATECIPLLGGDLGGTAPRQIRFRVRTGEGLQRKLPDATGRRIGIHEKRRWDESAGTAKTGGGDVELF